MRKYFFHRLSKRLDYKRRINVAMDRWVYLPFAQRLKDAPNAPLEEIEPLLRNNHRLAPFFYRLYPALKP